MPISSCQGRMCCTDPLISFIELHKGVKRATPEMFSLYKLSIILHKTFNEAIPETEWIGLNFEQVNMSRQQDFIIKKNQ
jgi:hypothetical protein